MRPRRQVDSNGCLGCSRCKVRKPISDFTIDIRNSSGHSTYCRDCQAKRQESRKVPSYQRTKEARKAYDRQHRVKFPEKSRAKSMVLAARRKGRLPIPSALPCSLCGKTAKDFHHPSYRIADYLNVVPLCRSCHIKEHDKTEHSAGLGVVALNIGMVRIAIASLT